MPPSSSDTSDHPLLPTTTDSVAETVSLGADLASTLEPGAVVALHGELGTGKTHLVKGIAEGLGISPALVRSPTFTILHTYEEGSLPLYHFDAYRVQTPDEFVELGFEEYVHGTGITCVEWAARVDSLLPPSAMHITISHVDPQHRRIAPRSHSQEDRSTRLGSPDP